MASLVFQLVKNLLALQETPVWFLGREDLLEKEQATYSGILGLSIIDINRRRGSEFWNDQHIKWCSRSKCQIPIFKSRCYICKEKQWWYSYLYFDLQFNKTHFCEHIIISSITELSPLFNSLFPLAISQQLGNFSCLSMGMMCVFLSVMLKRLLKFQGKKDQRERKY